MADMNRRGFLLGALAAPAVITTPGLLMPVKAVPLTHADLQRTWNELIFEGNHDDFTGLTPRYFEFSAADLTIDRKPLRFWRNQHD